MLGPVLLGRGNVLAVGVARLLRCTRTSIGRVQYAGVPVMWSADDRDHPGGTVGQVNEPGGPLALTTDCVADCGLDHRLITHVRPIQPTRRRSQLGGQLGSLNEETVTVREAGQQPLQLSAGEAMVDVTFVVSFHVIFLYRSLRVFCDVLLRSEALSGPRSRRPVRTTEHPRIPSPGQGSQALCAQSMIEVAPADRLPGYC